MYGLAGASRTGKTTLARKLSEELGIPFLDSSTTVLARKAGFNMVANMSIEDRISAQELLLKGYMELVEEAGKLFVTDRTPFDMLAYTLAEVSMHSCSAELGQRISDYGKACIAAGENTFAMVLHVAPLPSYEEQSDKPPLNKAYQDHIHLLIGGALMDSSVPTMLVEDGSVEERVRRVLLSLQRYLENVKESNAQEIIH